MKLLYAFIVSGIFCLVAQILLDNFKITPGHVTSIFTVVGAVLAFLGLYDKIIEFAGCGATVLISNFGNLLYKGCIEGFKSEGVLGLFTGLLSKSSAAISSAVIFAFLFTFIFKPKS